MTDQPLIGVEGTIFVGIYLFALILIGLAGRQARQEDTLADFYLTGRRLGFTVLFLTLYATQYSGNTLIGYAGAAYRQGFHFLVSIPFMMAVIGGYLVFAPRLHRLSKQEKFITLGDYLQHRFSSRTLTLIASLLCIFALGNYILANLKAIGYLVEETTGGKVSFVQGIFSLAFIMVLYESLGGLRSVAWTDVIQGILLIIGCVIIFITIQIHYGGISKSADHLLSIRPEFFLPPDSGAKRLWLSTLAIISFGVPVYPQAIQRIYAATDEVTLRRAFQIMVFMPLITTFFIVIIGLVGAARFPELDGQNSDRVILLLLTDMAHQLPGIGLLILIFLSAVVAAIMSTIDSALLSISSIIIQDFYRPTQPNISQAHLTRAGKIISWILMAGLAYLATVLPQTLWRLTEIKLEVLCQVAPALFLGIHNRSLHSSAVLSGLAVGTTLTFGFILFEMIGISVSTKPWGIHAGIWGLSANLLTLGLVSIRKNAS